jgi:hypothetical protein
MTNNLNKNIKLILDKIFTLETHNLIFKRDNDIIGFLNYIKLRLYYIIYFIKIIDYLYKYIWIFGIYQN